MYVLNFHFSWGIQARSDTDKHLFRTRDCEASHRVIESELFLCHAQEFLKRRRFEDRYRHQKPLFSLLSDVHSKVSFWNIWGLTVAFPRLHNRSRSDGHDLNSNIMVNYSFKRCSKFYKTKSEKELMEDILLVEKLLCYIYREMGQKKLSSEMKI